MLDYLAEPFKAIALQCSQYEGGARWCDFCGTRVMGKGKPDIHQPEHVEHKSDCPIQKLRNYAHKSMQVARAVQGAEPCCHASIEGVPASVWAAIDEVKEWREMFAKTEPSTPARAGKEE